MAVLDLQTPGMDIELSHDHVLINDRIKLLKPKGTSTTQWETMWERLGAFYAHNEGWEKDGHVVVDLENTGG